MPAPRIVLVRHGQTEWSESGQHTGTTDIELTDVGREQARALGRALAGRAFARVLTSPLRRAAETVELAGLLPAGGGPVEVVDDLREMDYGIFEGLTTPQIRVDRPGWTVWDGDVPEGETLAQVGARADRVLADVDPGDDGGDEAGDVALVGHGHLLRVLAARWVGLEPADGRRLALSTATLSELGHERERRVLWRWNEDAHLRVER